MLPKLTYRHKVTNKLRILFELSYGSLVLPGQIYEKQTQTPSYFWNFAGKFPWEVGDSLPPFRFMHEGQDLSSIVFFGVPQALVKKLYGIDPPTTAKFIVDTNRNCANCVFLKYDKDRVDEFYNRPTSERFEARPSSVYSCGVTGAIVDHLPPDTSERRTLSVLRSSLLENSCEAHTRRAYKIELSPDVRQDGQSERWVPAEHRRLQALNPNSIQYYTDKIVLPHDIEISFKTGI